jgi:PhnB protein
MRRSITENGKQELKMSKVSFRPKGFHAVTPYLIVSDAHAMIEFMKAAFGAEELYRMADPSGVIRHAEVRIDDSVIELGQSNEQYAPTVVALHLYVEDSDAVYQQALKAGAISQREVDDRFYGDREGGVIDPFGNQWYIATRKEEVSTEEMARRMAQMQTK